MPEIDYVNSVEKILFSASNLIMQDSYEKIFNKDDEYKIIVDFLELCWVNYLVNTDFFKQIVKTRIVYDEPFKIMIDKHQESEILRLTNVKNISFVETFNINN